MRKKNYNSDFGAKQECHYCICGALKIRVPCDVSLPKAQRMEVPRLHPLSAEVAPSCQREGSEGPRAPAVCPGCTACVLTRERWRRAEPMAAVLTCTLGYMCVLYAHVWQNVRRSVTIEPPVAATTTKAHGGETSSLGRGKMNPVDHWIS